ncbi:MAG: hypothetical protein HY735_19220 [Verrucomicrobia bacterium]|nr:hypothetical protein [Verrucomicrobiota bacterium]
MGEKFSRVLAWSPKRERMLAARRREPIWHEKYETEVGIDRRTVARVINERNVPAAGEAKGAPVYKLRDFLDGWRAEIADKAALPEQKELWDLLSEAMRTIKMFHDAHKC